MNIEEGGRDGLPCCKIELFYYSGGGVSWLLFHGMLFFFSMLLVLGTFSGVFAAAANASQLNESGWKYLFWGMTPAQVGEAMQKHGSRYDGDPHGTEFLLVRIRRTATARLCISSTSGDKNRLQWVRSGVGGTDLLFLDNRLFGVLVHDKASENAINDLLIKMIDYYPKAQLLPGDSPSNVIFQHQTAGRVIIWESDHQSFQTRFFRQEFAARIHGVSAPTHGK